MLNDSVMMQAHEARTSVSQRTSADNQATGYSPRKPASSMLNRELLRGLGRFKFPEMLLSRALKPSKERSEFPCTKQPDTGPYVA